MTPRLSAPPVPGARAALTSKEGHGGRARFRFVEMDHTGDAGYFVTAPTLGGLFEGAAAALMRHLTIVQTVAPRRAWRIRLRAADLPSLLHDWLAEILYRSYVRPLALCDVRVDAITDGPGGFRIDACVQGEPYREDRHERRPEVKAVTYHSLAVGRRGRRWHARFVLDM